MQKTTFNVSDDGRPRKQARKQHTAASGSQTYTSKTRHTSDHPCAVAVKHQNGSSRFPQLTNTSDAKSDQRKCGSSMRSRGRFGSSTEERTAHFVHRTGLAISAWLGNAEVYYLSFLSLRVAPPPLLLLCVCERPAGGGEFYKTFPKCWRDSPNIV